MKDRPLLKLRMQHGLSLNDVGKIVGVEAYVVAKMELGVPVDGELAQRLREKLAAYLKVALSEDVLPIRVVGDGGPERPPSGLSIGKL